MHCASFRQSNRRKQANWLALSLAGLLLGSGLAWSAAPPSFVYCLNQGGAKVFAGRVGADGNLAFGLSVWSPAGHNISVFGTATRREAGWQYADNLGASMAAERCRLDITRGADRAVHIVADPNATCQSYGGANTEIGTVQFSAKTYEGSVTTELDDPEAFQKAGKCVGGAR